MKRIFIFGWFVLVSVYGYGQKNGSKDFMWLTNQKPCLSPTEQVEIFKKIEIAPTLTETSVKELENKLQKMVDLIGGFEQGNSILVISVLFFEDNTHCIYKVGTDHSSMPEIQLKSIFENEDLFSRFTPARQLGINKTAESTIKLRLKKGKIKQMLLQNLEVAH